MRRGLPQLIVVAAVGLAFGMVYRYFLDEPSEASVANYLRSGGHPDSERSATRLREADLNVLSAYRSPLSPGAPIAISICEPAHG